MDTDRYSDRGTDIIKYGELKRREAQGKAKLIESGAVGGDSAGNEIAEAEELSDAQVRYINMIASGISWTEACAMIGISRATPFLWLEESDKDGTYRQCLELVKEIEANELENNVWQEALNNPKSTILKMFALKARKDEYKDNATPSTNLETNIYVKIGEKDYDVRANFKPAGGDGEEVSMDG